MVSFLRMAAEVSSQDDSMPNINVSFRVNLRIVFRMSKILKILGRTLGLLLEWTLIIVIFLAFAIRTSTVQTYFASLATNYLSNELNVEVRIDQVDIIFLDNIELKGILMKDQTGDTLFAAPF